MRVIKWAIEQVEGNITSDATQIGYVPAPGALDTVGISVSEADIAEASRVITSEWREEIPLIETWFETIGEKLPEQMQHQLNLLKAYISN